MTLKLRTSYGNSPKRSSEMTDYIDPLTGGLTRSGLVLNNPKAEATCGCGESFAI